MSNLPTSNPRKRAAPGATPTMPLSQPQQQPFVIPPQGQLLSWNGALPEGATFGDVSANPYLMSAQQAFAQSYQQPVQPVPPVQPIQTAQNHQASPSTALARRPPNRELMPTRPSLQASYDIASNGWVYPDGDDGVVANEGAGGNDNIELLEEKAQRVKRESQSKRKQIPPFVQKLSSYLEEQKNTDLIRWSEKGDSFIVLDEDEFAKTLIPELFKHNNYASFVRQLNMYGFHKRVGLSDNSMKASERKNKSPSEYVNPYFRRGHPNLLWLITKPKANKAKSTTGTKKDEKDGDSEEEVADETISPAYPAAQPSDFVQLRRTDLERIGKHIANLQEQQKTMSGIISKLRNDHNALYNQALAFQNMHDRHENSINAILNFLANVFRKSLEDQGAQNGVHDLLAQIIPTGQMPKGSVVDLGDFAEAFQHQQSPSLNPTGTPKRPQRLLPPIPPHGRASTVSPAASGVSSQQPASYRSGPAGQAHTVTEVVETPSEAATPDFLRNELQSNPQEGMMKIIQGTNAGSSQPDYLPQLAANTQANLSNDQRNRMISIMSAQSSIPNTTNGVSSKAAPTNPPPTIPESTAVASPTSLSPLFKSAIPTIPPALQDVPENLQELEALRRIDADTSHRIDDLTSILGPYSPSGQIPGLDFDGGQHSNYFDVDLDQYLDKNAYGDALGFDGGELSGVDGHGGDFNFNLDHSFDNAQGIGSLPVPGIDEARSSANTPSPAGTEEIPRHEFDQTPVSNSKRRRVS